MKEKSKRCLKIIFNIIFWIVIVAFAGIAALSVIAKKTDKPILDYSVLWVMTDSMEPNIESKSFILVKRANVAELKKGDIITFKSRNSAIAGSLNTHRIDEVVEQGKEFITKGDNNPIRDAEHVYAEDIKYSYVGNLHMLTFFGRVLASESGFMIFLSSIMLVVILVSIVSIKKTRNESKEELKEKEIDRLVKEEVERLENQNGKAD